MAVAVASACAQDGKTSDGIYTCVDAKGRRLTSDRPIVDCLDREQRVLGPTGTERRRVGPSLTEQERVALEARQRAEAQERSRIAEERRRERALLVRYPDQATHDAERAAALSQVDEVTALAQKNVLDLKEQRKKLDAEMEFYRKDPNKAPMPLRRQLAENDQLIAEQLRFLSGREQEKRRVNQRFDTELAQLRQLWASAGKPGGATTTQ